jgi:cyanate lyase
MTMIIPSTQLPTTASPRKKVDLEEKLVAVEKRLFSFERFPSDPTIFQYYETLKDVDGLIRKSYKYNF